MDKQQVVAHRVKKELYNWFSEVSDVSCSRCQTFQTAVRIDTHWAFETDIEQFHMPGNQSAGQRCNDHSQALHQAQKLSIGIDQGKHPQWLNQLYNVFTTVTDDKALSTLYKDDKDFGFDSNTFSYLSRCGGCHGSGDVQCGICDGRGKNDCLSCFGSGQIDCVYCHGTSIVKDGINPERRCGCYTGKVDCTICHSSGECSCGGCLGSGREPCSPCRGSGCFTNEFQVKVKAKARRSFAWNNADLPAWANTYLEKACHGGMLFLPWRQSLSFNPGKVTIDHASYPLACSAVAGFLATEADVSNEGVERECHFLGNSLDVLDLREIADKNAERVASALKSAGSNMDEINPVLSQNIYRAALKSKDGHSASSVEPVRKGVVSTQAIDTLLKAYKPLPGRLKKVGKSVKALPWLKTTAWSFLGLFILAAGLQFLFSSTVDVSTWSLKGLTYIPEAMFAFYSALSEGYVPLGFWLRFGTFVLIVYFLAAKFLLPRIARRKLKHLLNYAITFHVLYAMLSVVRMPWGGYDLVLLSGGGIGPLFLSASMALQAVPVLVLFSLILGWMLARRAADAVVFDFVNRVSIPELAKDLGYRH